MYTTTSMSSPVALRSRSFAKPPRPHKRIVAPVSATISESKATSCVTELTGSADSDEHTLCAFGDLSLSEISETSNIEGGRVPALRLKHRRPPMPRKRSSKRSSSIFHPENEQELLSRLPPRSPTDTTFPKTDIFTFLEALKIKYNGPQTSSTGKENTHPCSSQNVEYDNPASEPLVLRGSNQSPRRPSLHTWDAM